MRAAGDDDTPFSTVTFMLALGDVAGATLQVGLLLVCCWASERCAAKRRVQLRRRFVLAPLAARLVPQRLPQPEEAQRWRFLGG